MSIAFRKVWRDLWNFKGRTLLVVLSIAVGVMALGMTMSSDALLKRQMALSRARQHKPHASVSLAQPISDEVVAAIAAMPQVADAEGRLIVNIRWKPALESEWRDALLTVRPDYVQQTFDLLELKAGQWPGPDEVAVENTHAAYYGAQPGQRLYVLVNDRAVPLKVTGALRDPLQMPPDFSPLNKIALYVDRDTAEHLIGTRNYNLLRFTVPHYSKAEAQQALKEVQDKLERLGAVSAFETFSTDTFDPSGDMNQAVIDGLGLILIMMALFSLVLSVVLVINTINAIVAQQVTQIGIMKTIGGRYSQITTLYLAGVAVYGALSLVVAVPIGAFGGYQLATFWLKALNAPLMPFEILPQVFIYQLGVGLVTPLLAALWPVLYGVSIPVRQAIAAYGLGTGRYGSGWLDKLISQVQGIPRLAALALRNTFRRAGRAALTEITLASAGAIFMMVMTTGDSFNQAINNVWDSWGFDVIFTFEDFERISEIESLVRAQPDVNAVEMWSWVQAQTHKPGFTDPAHVYAIQLRGLPHGTQMFNAPLLAGRRLDPADDHAMVLNQKLAGQLGVRPGDTIVVDYGSGKEKLWQIVGLVSDIGVGGTQDTAFIWRVVLNADINQAGRASVVQIGTRQDTRAAQDALKSRLQHAFELQNIGVTFASGQLENKELAGALWGIIGGLLQMMTVLVAIVGSIGLSGTLSINVMERRREIGVMRAVGASSADVAMIFMGEGLLLGVTSWVVATPLSIVGARFFVDALGEALAFPFSYQYSYSGMWLWLGIVIGLSLAASWLPAQRATQISVQESLAYE